MNGIKSEFHMKKINMRSRLVMPPMFSGKADENGNVTKELLDYYDEKSRNDYLGMVIVEYAFISGQGRAKTNQISVADDGRIEGLSALADTIHKNGCSAVMQIVHAGGATTSDVTGEATVSPSCVPFGKRDGGEKILTESGIEQIVRDFADASVRVKKAGFDGVEIHSAHGYLLNQFCSPYTNKRYDEYGGNPGNRMRIHRMVIEAVREAVGEDFPILLRLGAVDDMDGGNSISDAVEMARILETTSLDILDVSGGLTGYTVRGKEGQQGYFSDVTGAIKEAVSLPVILTGGITDIHAADDLIREGYADLIGVGRAILEDPDWVTRSFESMQ